MTLTTYSCCGDVHLKMIKGQYFEFIIVYKYQKFGKVSEQYKLHKKLSEIIMSDVEWKNKQTNKHESNW